MIKHRKQFMLIGGLVLLLAAVLSFSPAAWATPGQDHLRQTVPTPTRRPDCPPPVGCELYAPFTLEEYLGYAVAFPATFDPPLEICVPYTQAQCDAVGGEANLTIVYWDPVTVAWVPLANPRTDPALLMVCGDLSYIPSDICGLGITCLLSPTGVPVTGQPAGKHDTAVTLLVAGTALSAVIGGAALALRGRRSQA